LLEEGTHKLMEQNEIFKVAQQYLRDVPLMLIGTGGTIPYGIPGMKELAEYLINSLGEKYKADPQWDTFSSNINSGQDLESALTNISLKKEILEDIICQTWVLVNDYDLRLFYKILESKTVLPIAKLIKKLLEPHPQCVNIITTNYDRVIEYACDQIKINVDKRFVGYYIKYFSNTKLQRSKVVNLIKVHGSLDLFRDENDYVYSIPLQKDIPINFIPEIITPGEDKYKTILNGECRDLVHIADDLINDAKSYLCIGYGFNDKQIQRNIIAGIKQDKPIVVVTRKISDESAGLIINNSKNYIIIQEDHENTENTDIIVNGNRVTLEGTYWTVEGLLKII